VCVYRELKFLLTPLRVTFKNCFKIFLVGFSDFRCKFRGDCYCNTWILLGLLVKNIVWPCPVSNKTILSLFALKISIFFPYFVYKTSFCLNSFWKMEIVSVRSFQIVLWPNFFLKVVKVALFRLKNVFPQFVLRNGNRFRSEPPDRFVTKIWLESRKSLAYFGWKTSFCQNSFWKMEIVSVRSLQIVLWPKLELKDVKSLAHFGSL